MLLDLFIMTSLAFLIMLFIQSWRIVSYAKRRTELVDSRTTMLVILLATPFTDRIKSGKLVLDLFLPVVYYAVIATGFYLSIFKQTLEENSKR